MKRFMLPTLFVVFCGFTGLHGMEEETGLNTWGPVSIVRKSSDFPHPYPFHPIIRVVCEGYSEPIAKFLPQDQDQSDEVKREMRQIVEQHNGSLECIPYLRDLIVNLFCLDRRLDYLSIAWSDAFERVTLMRRRGILDVQEANRLYEDSSTNMFFYEGGPLRIKLVELFGGGKKKLVVSLQLADGHFCEIAAYDFFGNPEVSDERIEQVRLKLKEQTDDIMFLQRKEPYKYATVLDLTKKLNSLLCGHRESLYATRKRGEYLRFTTY